MLEIEKIIQNIKVTEEKEGLYKSKYIVEPLYRGYGNTIGNALRRVLLSSTPGAAIKGIKIDGVLNEFSTISGIKEAITDVVLNIKEIVIKTDVPGENKLQLSIMGPKIVTGADIQNNSDVEVVNPDQVILTITEEKEVNIEFLIDTGFGFMVAEEIDTENWEVGYIAVDAIYTPIRKISYRVEDTMVGRITNFDKLTMEVETDGSIEIKDIMSYAVDILIKHLEPILEIGNKLENFRELSEADNEEEVADDKLKEKDIAHIKMEELDLTVRSYNCLRKAGIETLGELSKLGIQDLLKIKNLGRKSLTEIIDKLREYGFELANLNEIE